jgi:signal transduction histidine kinase
MHIAEGLAQLYEQRGDVAQALANYRRFHTLERTLFSEALSEKTRQLQIIHQVETAKQEAELKRVEAELAQLRTIELQALLHEADRQRAIVEEASNFKTKLLSIAAHDLRNPLCGISGYAELLLKQLPEDVAVQELAQHIFQSTQRMRTMLEDLLDSTRIESGGLHLELERLDLAALAHEVVEANEQSARRKAQTLLIDAALACPVRADRSCMLRVLENLLGNAIKFSPYGRRIWVTLTHNDEHVRCAVRDEGPGLTADDQQRAFGRFERLSATPTGGENSTGLGLAIVRQLVELQGGRAWAESAGPGQGSTFLLELPIWRG